MATNSTLSGLKRRLWIIGLLGVAGVAAAAVPEPEQVEDQATTFRARHTMLVNDSGGVSSSVGVSPNQVVLLATTGEVPQRVASELEFSGNPAELASQVTVEFNQSTGALTFSTSLETAEEAELLPDVFAEATNAYLVERQDVVYQQRVQASRTRLEGFEDELDDITAQLFVDPENPALLAQRDAISRQYSVAFEQDRSLAAAPGFLSFTTLQNAQAVPVVDRGLSAPRGRGTRAVMGLVAGLVLGTGIAVLLGRLDRKIRSREQAEEALGMRARVEVPAVRQRHQGRGVVVVDGRHDALSDSYRTLRNVVGFVQGGLDRTDRAHVTVVVSPGQGDGKTSLATNLAAAFVETGRRTIAVNTDFRRPRLAEAINGYAAPDLPFLLEDLELLDSKLLLSHTDRTNLLMMDLSSIDASPGELVRATARSLSDFIGVAEEIVIDTSPVGATAEPLDIVPFADVIVMVVRLGHTSVDAAERTLTRLRDISTVPIVLAISGTKLERGKYTEYGGRSSYTSTSARRSQRAAEVGQTAEPVSP